MNARIKKFIALPVIAALLIPASPKLSSAFSQISEINLTQKTSPERSFVYNGNLFFIVTDGSGMHLNKYRIPDMILEATAVLDEGRANTTAFTVDDSRGFLYMVLQSTLVRINLSTLTREGTQTFTDQPSYAIAVPLVATSSIVGDSLIFKKSALNVEK